MKLFCGQCFSVVLGLACSDEKNLEEVLLLEAVGGAGLEVHLDVLPLLEGRLHCVDLLHRPRRDRVDESGIGK